ncbi:hypothetical protein QFC22_005667 [Naganishia vaughanmartiniae]|uniref:Uncharacterized protein n=1 Tax=Naganishia vaughanmartiniae TaxID=1424756 RepID=A0ACC2WSC9_9TREE|nr:hypothetical protein QFC22_005667 [Naganishia vaughanmartiniae]
MSTTTPTPTDWQWYPASQCYYSPSTGISAIQDPHTGGWTYRSNVGSQDQDVQPSRVDTVAGFSESGRGGGIGDVGWALEADLDAEPSYERDEKKNGTTTAIDLADKNALDTTAMTAAVTSVNEHVALPEATIGEATHRVQPTQTATAAVPKILRLVLLPSSSASSTTTTSAHQGNKPRVAILDSRPSGYLIGRDRSLGSAVLRVKEMGVSRVHARVWRGFKEEEEEGGIEVGQEGGERNREKAWWIVDCGTSAFFHE